ncbi:hypothetical protein ACHAWF_007030 [Thalassiosira exigua]
MTGVKLIRTDIKNHPRFGTSSNAKNNETKCYSLGNLTVKFIKEEWWDSFDTDCEFRIEIDSLCFEMFPDDCGDIVESRMSMSRRGGGGDEIALLVTKIKDGEGIRGTAISAKIEDGSASEMNEEWIRLANASALSVKVFTECLIEEFGVFWFGGIPFLPSLAAEESKEESDVDSDELSDEDE